MWYVLKGYDVLAASKPVVTLPSNACTQKTKHGRKCRTNVQKHKRLSKIAKRQNLSNFRFKLYHEIALKFAQPSIQLQFRSGSLKVYKSANTALHYTTLPILHYTAYFQCINLQIFYLKSALKMVESPVFFVNF